MHPLNLIESHVLFSSITGTLHMSWSTEWICAHIQFIICFLCIHCLFDLWWCWLKWPAGVKTGYRPRDRLSFSLKSLRSSRVLHLWVPAKQHGGEASWRRCVLFTLLHYSCCCRQVQLDSGSNVWLTHQLSASHMKLQRLKTTCT